MDKAKSGDNAVNLGQFLKIIGVAGTGGEGKLMIQEGLVAVNGEIECRRGKKLSEADVVTVQVSGRSESFAVRDYVGKRRRR